MLTFYKKNYFIYGVYPQKVICGSLVLVLNGDLFTIIFCLKYY